jgi:hypothetical protein
MKRFLFATCLWASLTPLFAADAPGVAISKILDKQLSSVEREVVSLAEAMPAGKYGFAPRRPSSRVYERSLSRWNTSPSRTTRWPRPCWARS